MSWAWGRGDDRLASRAGRLLLRGPRVVGALLVALGLLPLALLSPDATVAGRSPPHGLALLLAVVSVAGWVWLYVPPALLAAYFPDGRLGGG